MQRHTSILTRKRQLQLQVYSVHSIMKFIEESHTPESWVIPQWPLAAPEARETGRCKLQDPGYPKNKRNQLGSLIPRLRAWSSLECLLLSPFSVVGKIKFDVHGEGNRRNMLEKLA